MEPRLFYQLQRSTVPMQTLPPTPASSIRLPRPPGWNLADILPLQVATLLATLLASLLPRGFLQVFHGVPTVKTLGAVCASSFQDWCYT